MTEEIIFKTVRTRAIIKRMLIGAAIGLGVIALFVFSENNPKPEWGANWKIKPLILTPIIAALGTLSFILTDIVPSTGWKKMLAYIAAVIGFILAMWIGIVLGLNGTLWD